MTCQRVGAFGIAGLHEMRKVFKFAGRGRRHAKEVASLVALVVRARAAEAMTAAAAAPTLAAAATRGAAAATRGAAERRVLRRRRVEPPRPWIWRPRSRTK